MERSSTWEKRQPVDTASGATEPANGVRPPRQQRSKASLERVLTAGADVLTDLGFEAFTVNEVARRAGATTGLIYTRFDNKNALFEAIMVRETSRLVEEENRCLEELAGRHPNTPDLIDGIVHLLADIAKREAPLTKVFMERATIDPALADHVKRLRTAPRRVAELLLERRDDLTRDDPERAVDMAFWIATSALERRLHTEMWRHWYADPDDDWDLFVGDLIRALQAFLLHHPQPGQTR